MWQKYRIVLPSIKLDEDFVVSNQFISEYEINNNTVNYHFYVPALEYSEREYLIIPEIDNKLPGHSLFIDFGENKGRESLISAAYNSRGIVVDGHSCYYRADFTKAFDSEQEALRNVQRIEKQLEKKVSALYSSLVSAMIVSPQKIETEGNKSYLYTTFTNSVKNKFVTRFYYLPYYYKSSVNRNVKNGYEGFLHQLTEDPNFKYAGIRRSNDGVKQYYVAMIQENVDKDLSYADAKYFYQNKAKEDIEAIQNGYKHAMESFTKEKEDKKDFTVHNMFGDVKYTAVSTYSYIESEDKWHTKLLVRLFIPSNSAISDLFINAMESNGFKDSSNPEYSVNVNGNTMDIHYFRIGHTDTNTIEEAEAKTAELVNQFHSVVQQSVMLAMQTRQVER